MSDVNDPTPEQVLSHALDVARAAGASFADGVFAAGRSTSVKVRMGQTEKVTQSREHGLGIRVLVGAPGELRTATTSTSDLSFAAIEQLVRHAVEAARLTAPDPFAGLPEPSDEPLADVALDLWDEDVARLDADRALALALETEARALEVDRRLTNSEGAEMSWGWSQLHLATSTGVFRDKRATSIGLWTTPVGEQDGDKQRDYWYSSARHLGDLLSPAEIGREAARRTLRRLGARKPKTTKVPVIYEAPIASRLIGVIAGAANGGAIYRDASYLIGKLGQAIASPHVTLRDDPHIVRGAASRLFDGEGLPTRPFTLVEAGVLKSWVLDTYAGKKLGLPTTRSAWRGLGGSPSPGTSNLWMDNGVQTLDELISDLDEGLLVTDTFGGGANTVTGDYSQGAVGLWIEGGKLAYPVHELTIASTLPEMWMGLDAIANDRDPTRATSAPSFRIGRMTIAGA
ncbi:MAG: TldD/PmbA family protein [Deltaproteobacteria bacterium]|nr:TldD/PmbA family protein [Deltaproteobacteria bacterium]